MPALRRTLLSICLAYLMTGQLGAQEETTARLEQITQELQQLRQEERRLDDLRYQALLDTRRMQEDGRWQRPLDKYLASTPFPMPPRACQRTVDFPALCGSSGCQSSRCQDFAQLS